MPRASSHESKGGTTSERLERLGREMMPIFRIVCAGCMCESDSTPSDFCVRAENTPDYLLRPSAGSAERPGTPSPRMRRLAERLKLLFRAGTHPRRFRPGLFRRGSVRIAASPELKRRHLLWLCSPLGVALSRRI